ncbi:ATP-binding cassette domain-containing protein [Streptomyces justiciae]|nr:ATP-binding cassette domain-containing protein [Streptomyces justiciae]
MTAAASAPGTGRVVKEGDAMSGDVVLRAEGLHSGYRGVEVLRGVDLEVRAGEVVALLGRNGAGKTTTLMALAGMLPVTAGSITWLGNPRPPAAHHRARQGLRFLAERSVFSQLSVAANLRLGGGDVDVALELFPELRKLLDRRAGLLSGGEQQMLALGRAMSAQPRALLIDELSLGLAPVIVNRLIEATKVAAERGCAVLLVEQQIKRVLSVAERVYLLNRGTISFSGTREDLLAKPDIVEETYFAGAEEAPAGAAVRDDLA